MKKPKIEPLARVKKCRKWGDYEVYVSNTCIRCSLVSQPMKELAVEINAAADEWAKRNYGSFLPAEKCLPKQFGKWKVVIGKWKVVKSKKKARK